MFERFTDRARRVVVLAQEESRMLNHAYIGTEHILLGLIHEGEGVAAQALGSLGISLEAVRQQVEEIVGPGEAGQSGHIPFTSRAKKVLELSLREAMQLGHNYIGTEHVLLGLVREGEGVAVRVLVNLGADLSRVRQTVVQLIHTEEYGEERLTRRGRRGRQAQSAEIVDRLDLIARRLAAIERRLGIPPEQAPEVPQEIRELDEQIARVSGEKRAAIDERDFQKAAALHDEEKQLLKQQAEKEKELALAASERAPAGAGTGAGSAAVAGSAAGTGAGGGPGAGAGSAAGAGPGVGAGAGGGSGAGAGSAAGAGPGAGADIVAIEEADRLRAEVGRLKAVLREHGLDPGDSPS